MPLQLDPRLPLVWRSPQSLQFGVDRPPVILETVTSAEERMIAALVTGVTRPGLAVVAERAGASSDDVETLLDRLSPALRTPEDRALLGGASRGDVVVSGDSLTAVRVRTALAAAGLAELAPPFDRAHLSSSTAGSLTANSSAANSSAEPTTPSLAVVVAHFVVDPVDQGRWLRRDVPHLPIVLGDTGAQLGPFVEPGLGPCLHCLERHRTDADAAWPAIASQLWGRVSPAESAMLAIEVAAIAVRMVSRRLADGPSAAAVSVALDAETGQRVSREWQPHPECGCASPPGSGSAGGRLRAVETIPPTRGEALSEPA